MGKRADGWVGRATWPCAATCRPSETTCPALAQRVELGASVRLRPICAAFLRVPALLTIVGDTEHSVVGGFRMNEQEMKAELERLKAENETLKTRASRAISMKVSEKGGVSIHGLGRFPVTLYKEQWAKLLDMADEIRAFLKDNDSKLKTKP